MRILFMESHPMLVNGLPNGFRTIGCQVKVSGPLTEENIPKLLAEFQPDLVFSLGWSLETTHEKAEWLHKHTHLAKRPLVYWATEDPTHTLSFTLPYLHKLKPDFVFTICTSMVDFYHSLNIPSAHMDFGYHPGVHFKTTPDSAYQCDIAVVANAYPHILQRYPHHYRIQSLKTLIAPLVSKGIRIDFWGRGWGSMQSILGCSIPTEWLHGYIDYPQSNQVYNGASIVLGLQNQLLQLSQRTYEILGAGGFLITSNTPEIQRLFVSGHDLVAVSSPEQTLEQITHYLENPEQRQRISTQGQQAVSQHTYANRASDMLRILHAQGVLSGEKP
ncbi:MAG: CgeB family protein [Christensenellales bacterium]|jgi:spore maturation protein CgeB